jgi:hypothetical protein
MSTLGRLTARGCAFPAGAAMAALLQMRRPAFPAIWETRDAGLASDPR